VQVLYQDTAGGCVLRMPSPGVSPPRRYSLDRHTVVVHEPPRRRPRPAASAPAGRLDDGAQVFEVRGELGVPVHRPVQVLGELVVREHLARSELRPPGARVAGARPEPAVDLGGCEAEHERGQQPLQPALEAGRVPA